MLEVVVVSGLMAVSFEMYPGSTLSAVTVVVLPCTESCLVLHMMTVGHCEIPVLGVIRPVAETLAVSFKSLFKHIGG